MQPLHYTAFSDDPAGGNPAGVVLDASGMDEVAMLGVARELGYSETAFLFPDDSIRYFSPLAEVPFCGHATVATAVARAERVGVGELTLATQAGPVVVTTAVGGDGKIIATLTSVEPRAARLTALPELVEALGWSVDDLDPGLPPAVAYAGAWHPIVGVSTRWRLSRLEYDMQVLGGLMAEHGWTTVDLVWRESATVFHCRNPFPPGGVVEDPATGAAAAAFGGYLRERGLASGTVTVYQGADMGRPGTITVTIPETGGIQVSGTAVAI